MLISQAFNFFDHDQGADKTSKPQYKMLNVSPISWHNKHSGLEAYNFLKI